VKRDALGIHEPVYGRLTSDMLVPYGEPVPLEALIAPAAEPEIAFVIGRPVEAPATLAAVLAATEAVFAAVEVVDSRYAARFRLPDSVADNAGAARFALGSRACRPADLVDLRLLGCVFRCRGRVETAAGGAVMGHPAAALVWLVNALAARGERLEPGTIVLSGGLTASARLLPGATATAEFDGLGSVTVRC
jgi:2-keto-4-pentenoate hydratase